MCGTLTVADDTVVEVCPELTLALAELYSSEESIFLRHVSPISEGAGGIV